MPTNKLTFEYPYDAHNQVTIKVGKPLFYSI